MTDMEQVAAAIGAIHAGHYRRAAEILLEADREVFCPTCEKNVDSAFTVERHVQRPCFSAHPPSAPTAAGPADAGVLVEAMDLLQWSARKLKDEHGEMYHRNCAVCDQIERIKHFLRSQPKEAAPTAAAGGDVIGALAQARSFIGGMKNWRKGYAGDHMVYSGSCDMGQLDELCNTLDAALAAAPAAPADAGKE